MIPLTTALQVVRRRIADAARASGREPEDIALLAVAKSFPPQAVRDAYAADQRAFGENYLQEALLKMDALRDLVDAQWHFIGPLQTNKTKLVAESFAWVHSIDRLKIAQRLSDARLPTLPPLNCCIQVNISQEASKSGVQPSDALDLARIVCGLPRLHLRGFMGIAEPGLDVARQRAQFSLLRGLLQRSRSEGLRLDTLSMGMSDDLEGAIAEGATLVRVGSAIFGARPTSAAGQRQENIY